MPTMVFASGKYRTVFVSVALVLFLAVSIASMTAIGSGMGPIGVEASHCPLMPGMSSLCQMNPLEHIAAWQSMFAAIPKQYDMLASLLLLLVASFAIGTFLMRRVAYPPPMFTARQKLTYRQSNIPFTDSLREALADGILHPKVYG